MKENQSEIRLFVPVCKVAQCKKPKYYLKKEIGTIYAGGSTVSGTIFLTLNAPLPQTVAQYFWHPLPLYRYYKPLLPCSKKKEKAGLLAHDQKEEVENGGNGKCCCSGWTVSCNCQSPVTQRWFTRAVGSVASFPLKRYQSHADFRWQKLPWLLKDTGDYW